MWVKQAQMVGLFAMGLAVTGCETFLENSFPEIFSDVIVRERPFGVYELELEILDEDGGGHSFRAENKLEEASERVCPQGYSKRSEWIDRLPYDPPADLVRWEIECRKGRTS